MSNIQHRRNPGETYGLTYHQHALHKLGGGDDPQLVSHLGTFSWAGGTGKLCIAEYSGENFG